MEFRHRKSLKTSKNSLKGNMLKLNKQTQTGKWKDKLVNELTKVNYKRSFEGNI